tara:strand:+ start:200 stop:337 length:138 start_codon:yes stop_codon:yes gene_type:complete
MGNMVTIALVLDEIRKQKKKLKEKEGVFLEPLLKGGTPPSLKSTG